MLSLCKTTSLSLFYNDMASFKVDYNGTIQLTDMKILLQTFIIDKFTDNMSQLITQGKN